MINRKIIQYLALACILFVFQACSIPALVEKTENRALPGNYRNSQDTTNSAKVDWRDYFTDAYLYDLIETALKNNQELNIVQQEINISQNEVMARKGEYLPFVNVQGATGVEKVGRYTSQGANDANTEIRPGREFPDPLPDFMLAGYASWEVDIWKKLRNAKKSALTRYLSSVEGKNFLVTQLVAEVAGSYFELMALDNQLENVRRTIEIQQNVLKIIKLQKQAAKVTELAVRKFEAEVLKNQSLQYALLQEITETENRINFLLGRYPQPIQRNSQNFTEMVPEAIFEGIPSQLLANRPDIRQAELELAASKLDVQVARAEFYPSLRLTAGLGLQAFNPKLLVTTPESILFNLAGDMVMPAINRNAIKANYYSANSRQIQAVYSYEQSVLNAYIEVVNQLSNVSNLESSYQLKVSQVNTLTESVDIATRLFQSARADYMEILLTQRDALEARMEMIETKKQQMDAMVRIYQALGGGWN
ncbi:MAG: TolC family protein [Bacteroidia bacterium]